MKELIITDSVPKVYDLIMFSNKSVGIVVYVKVVLDFPIIVTILAFGKLIRLDMTKNWVWNSDGYWKESRYRKDNLVLK